MVSENDIYKLNEMIFSKNSNNSNILLKNVFFTKELIGIYISVFLIILFSILLKTIACKKEMFTIISLAIISLCFLYSFLVVLFMTIKMQEG